MTTHRRRTIFALLSILCFVAQVATLRADDKSARSLELFEKHVRPTLLSECIRCHGPDKQQGGLRLDSREAVRSGGDSGPAIMVGDATNSLLIQAIGYEDSALEMPPRGKLPESTIAGIAEWVATGAADPRNAPTPSGSSDETQHAAQRIETGKEFWCFQPVSDEPIPAVSQKEWPRSTIDYFVLQPLEAAGIRPNRPADRATLLRRVYYDLIGIPPTPQQVLDFVNSTDPNAYEALIDRLLESPQFGERWGRHWLDVVRYAESSGGGRTLLFPNAWRYRDYVVDAFNNDMPYDQFVREQIAGDLLEYDDWKDRRRKLVATAFLLLGPTNYELQDKDILEMDVVDEQIDTIGKAMLGMTIGCARCHDHKFDPIPAEDYYAMAGILRSTKAMIHSNVSTWNKVKLPMEASEEASFDMAEQRLAKLERRLATLKKNKGALATSLPSSQLSGIVVDNQSAELVGRWMTSSFTSRYVDGSYIHDEGVDRGTKRVIFRPTVPADGDYEVRVSYSAGSNRASNVPIKIVHANGDSTVLVNQKRKPKIRSLFHSLGVFSFQAAVQASITISNEGTNDGVVIADAIQLVAVGSSGNGTAGMSKEDRPNQQAVRDEIKSLQSRIAKLKKENTPRPVAMATADDDDASDIHLAIRGVVHNKGPVIKRGVLRVASQQPKLVIPKGESGRRELAQWVTDPSNPLTSRVFANRVWHWLMGRGLVSTVDNFGSMGTKPTHPELLDHLASRFITDGWSTKQLIRHIMLSRVYQMGSAGDSRSEKLDPSNRLFWRMNRKRLDAESIRDSLLFAGGNLDLTVGGENVKPGTKSEYGYEFTSQRRSVYVPVFRNTLPELFEVFDFADPNTQRGSRSESVIASQALLLMNHPFVMEQAERAAKRLQDRAFSSNDARLDHIFLQVLGRTPAPEERAITGLLLDKAGTDRVSALSTIYQSLFSCIDFRYAN